MTTATEHPPETIETSEIEQLTSRIAELEAELAAAKDAKPPDEEPERKPLLDLSELTDRRDYIVAPDDKRYFLRTDGLGSYEHHELMHATARHDELMGTAKLDEDQKRELNDLVATMLAIVLDAPVKVLKSIKASQARQIIGHFQRASQPEVDQQMLMALLAGALQQKTTPEPEASSIKAS